MLSHMHLHEKTKLNYYRMKQSILPDILCVSLLHCLAVGNAAHLPTVVPKKVNSFYYKLQQNNNQDLRIKEQKY